MDGRVAFRKRHERIDWRKLASVDVDRIIQNLDITTLQDNLGNIAFANIEQEVDMARVDPNFLKLFRMAQLMIEYLLYSQDYLASEIQRREIEAQTMQNKFLDTQKETERLRSELSDVKKECHKRKKLLAMQQHLLHNSSLQNGGGGITSDRNQCPVCQKRMINEDFLEAHVVKHHPDRVAAFMAMRGKSVPSSQAQMQAMDEKERELNELRNKLLQKDMEMNNLRLQQQAQFESSRKSTADLNQELENRLRDSQLAHEREIQKMRDVFTQEVRDLNVKLQNYERTFVEARQNASAANSLQSSLRDAKASNLGELRDDERVEMQRRHEADKRELNAAMDQRFNEFTRALKMESEERERAVRAEYEQQLAKVRRDLERSQANARKKDDELKLMLDAVKKRKRDEKLRKQKELEMKASLEATETLQTSMAVEKPFVQATLSEVQESVVTDFNQVQEEVGRKSAARAASKKRAMDETDLTSALSNTGEFATSVEMAPFDGVLSQVGLLEQNGYRLQPAMQRNQQLLRVERARVEQLLLSFLNEHCDIAPDSTRITNTILHDRRDLLRRERETLAKTGRFTQIRQAALLRIEEIAQAKLRGTQVPAASPSNSRQNSVRSRNFAEEPMQLGGTLTMGGSKQSTLPVTYTSTPQMQKRARSTELFSDEAPAAMASIKASPTLLSQNRQGPSVPARDNLRSSQLSNTSESATPHVTWRDREDDQDWDSDEDEGVDQNASPKRPFTSTPKAPAQTDSRARANAGAAAKKEVVIGGDEDDDFSSISAISDNDKAPSSAGRPPQRNGAPSGNLNNGTNPSVNGSPNGSQRPNQRPQYSGMDSIISETNTFGDDQWELSSKAVSTVNPAMAGQPLSGFASATGGSPPGGLQAPSAHQQTLQASKDPTEWDISDFEDE